MFTTTSIKKFLFEGYYDPSITKYFNLKYQKYNVKFECLERLVLGLGLGLCSVSWKLNSNPNYNRNHNPNHKPYPNPNPRPYDSCGIQNYQCNSAGMILQLPHGKSHQLSYKNTSKDEYFTPFFVLRGNGDLIWPYSMIKSTAEYAIEIMKTDLSIVKLRNPIYAAYPGMNSKDKDFNKHLHRQSRILNGLPNLFSSTYDTFNTGRKNVRDTLSIEKFRGNSTITLLPKFSTRGIDLNVSAMVVRGADGVKVRDI